MTKYIILFYEGGAALLLFILSISVQLAWFHFMFLFCSFSFFPRFCCCWVLLWFFFGGGGHLMAILIMPQPLRKRWNPTREGRGMPEESCSQKANYQHSPITHKQPLRVFGGSIRGHHSQVMCVPITCSCYIIWSSLPLRQHGVESGDFLQSQ